MPPHRRLAAVMFTDLAGFTTLSQDDEAGTLRILAEHRALVRSVLPEFGGREVKTTGDGFLVEFESALTATQCAVEIQRRSDRGPADADVERPLVRIGIHVGDVVEEDGDILGDAVNIASRIEPLAEPGGICVSRAVHDQVANKVPELFEALPTPVLKGVHTPIDVFRVVRTGAPRQPAVRASAAHRIAVLPLASISPDPADEYLADGLTDELIGSVARLGGLTVIARSSVDYYRTRAKPLPQIGHELNVRSVVEGSVRRSGDRIRVTIQLTDVASQAPVWVHQEERTLGDVFAIQSEIAVEVANRLRDPPGPGPHARSPGPPPRVPASYLAYLKGRSLLRGLTLPSAQQALAHFEEAVRLDPSNARAYVGLADASLLRTMLSGEPFARVLETLGRCKELAERSIALDPNAAESHASLAHFQDELYEFAAAERELVAAFALQPTLAAARRWHARLLTEKGRLPDALDELTIAEEADPLSSEIQSILARTLIALGRTGEARVRLQRLGELEPESMRWHYVRFELALASGDAAQLLPEATWLADHDPNGSERERRAYWLGLYHAVRGDRAELARSIATLEGALAEGSGRMQEWAAEELAELYAVGGNLDDCLRHLRSAVASRAWSIELWQTRATLADVRADARFRELLAEVGLLPSDRSAGARPGDRPPTARSQGY